MKMLLREVSELLDDEGFERQGIEVQYCGERVGRQWHDELVLVNEYPGITYKYYENADKTSVKYKDKESKEKMVAAIRTYFNQRKINAAIANMPGPDELAPVNPFSKQTFPSPPSLQRLLE